MSIAEKKMEKWVEKVKKREEKGEKIEEKNCCQS